MHSASIGLQKTETLRNPLQITVIPKLSHDSTENRTCLHEITYHQPTLHKFGAGEWFWSKAPPPHLRTFSAVMNHSYHWIICVFCVIVVMAIKMKSNFQAPNYHGGCISLLNLQISNPTSFFSDLNSHFSTDLTTQLSLLNSHHFISSSQLAVLNGLIGQNVIIAFSQVTQQTLSSFTKCSYTFSAQLVRLTCLSAHSILLFMSF